MEARTVPGGLAGEVRPRTAARRSTGCVPKLRRDERKLRIADWPLPEPSRDRMEAAATTALGAAAAWGLGCALVAGARFLGLG